MSIYNYSNSRRIKKIKLHPVLPIALNVSQVAYPTSVLVRLQNNDEDHAVICRTLANGNLNVAKINSRDYLEVDQNNKSISESSKKSKSILGTFFAALFFVFALSMSVLNYTNQIDLRIVQTDSMKPSFKPGDLIFGVSTNFKTPKIGDVAVFTAKTLDGQEVAPFSHRIVDGNQESGFVTKGDANPLVDVVKPKIEDVISVVIFTIPFGGILVSIKPLLIALLSGAIVYTILKK